jgi:hypothetical protein
MRKMAVAMVLACLGVLWVPAAAEAAKPSLTIKDAERYEPGNKGGSLAFTVRLSAPSRRQVKVDWATADATATSADDYTALAGTLTFKPGETRKKVSIPILGDGVDEEDETFTVTLSNPRRSTIADADATGTIWDADPPPSISVGSVAGFEGDAGTTPVTISVTLSHPSALTVSATVTSTGVEATKGVDFTSAADGTITFLPGETDKVLDFAFVGDTDVEPDESWEVVLTDLVNCSAGDDSGSGLLVNDD